MAGYTGCLPQHSDASAVYKQNCSKGIYTISAADFHAHLITLFPSLLCQYMRACGQIYCSEDNKKNKAKTSGTLKSRWERPVCSRCVTVYWSDKWCTFPCGFSLQTASQSISWQSLQNNNAKSTRHLLLQAGVKAIFHPIAKKIPRTCKRHWYSSSYSQAFSCLHPLFFSMFFKQYTFWLSLFLSLISVAVFGHTYFPLYDTKHSVCNWPTCTKILNSLSLTQTWSQTPAWRQTQNFLMPY